mgnify:FL=1
MTIPRSAAEVLESHVTLEVECIDRMYLNVYQPKLQFAGGLVQFLRGHRGNPIASTALVNPMTKSFVADIQRYAKDHGLGIVAFERGQRKDDIAAKYRADFEGTEGVYLIGRAQEKTGVFRTEKRRNPETGKTYPWIVRTSGIPNHYYFYAIDDDFGPFFLKFCTYFPYNAKLCINGNEWAKRQATKAGIGHTALDNGFLTCDDPDSLAKICGRLGPTQIDALLRKWLALLPHPFTGEDRAAGYRYDISVLQAEFSLTQVLDRPLSGRVFFEDLIRENLDLGRPDKVSLIFNRQIRTRGKRPTPSRFRTRILTEGVIPSLHVDYKHSKIKQYHKEGRALRTETTINDTRDFGVRKRLEHLPELAEIGFAANRRLLATQRASHDPIAGDTAYEQVCTPTIVNNQRAPALRFGDQRTHALLSTLVLFGFLPAGFTNKDLRDNVAPLLGKQPGTMTSGQATYDLRRLRLHGLIKRIPKTHRYLPTETGLATALFLTRAYNRLIRPGLADLTDPNATGDLHHALHRFNKELDHHLTLAA